MNGAALKARKWHQEPLVWMLLAIPLSSVLVGGIMLWLAVTNEDGLVANDYYKRGLEINRTLGRDAVAARHQVTAELGFIGETGRITADVRAAPGFDYPPALTLDIHHAVKPGHDLRLELTRISDTVYAGPLPPLVPGRWHLVLHADDWRLLDPVVLPTESVNLAFSADRADD